MKLVLFNNFLRIRKHVNFFDSFPCSQALKMPTLKITKRFVFYLIQRKEEKSCDNKSKNGDKERGREGQRDM